MSYSSHILATVPAMVLGLIAGIMAAIFTLLNLKIMRLRDALTGHMRWGRCVEPCLLTLLYVTGAMVLPLFFPCTPTECVFDEVRGEGGVGRRGGGGCVCLRGLYV